MGEAKRDNTVKLKSNGDYWQAWWFDPKAPGGKRVRSLGSKTKLSKRQATAKCRELDLDRRLNRVRNAGDVPRLSSWVEQYKGLRTDLEEATRKLVDQVGRQLLLYFDNDPPIDQITRADAAGWRAALARGELRAANVYPKPDDKAAKNTRYHRYRKAMKGRATKPPSESTVCKLVRTAKRMFEEAADEDGLGLIDRNPFRRLSGKAPRPHKEWATVTASDLDAIRDACPNEAWRLAFTLCRLAGLRRGEAMRLRWQDVDWQRNRVTVNATLAKATTKKRRRVVPIEPGRCPTGLAKILRAAFESAPDGATLVCEGETFENVDRDAKAIVAKAGLPAYAKPFHTLRKNREGELARAYPQHVLKEWMGHDPEVADEHYLRVDEDLYEPPPQAEAQSVPQ